MKPVIIILCVLFSLNLFAGDIKYLIITHHNFYDAVQPLAQWKNSKGLKTQVISIHSGLNSSAIRDTIRKYQPEYVLLVGDRNYIPLGKFYANWSLYQAGTWTDQFYADTSDDGNYLDDIYVGRLPCNYISQCSNMVNKIFFYEQGRFTNFDWLLKATGIARDLENSPTGNYDSCYRSAIRDVKEKLVNYGFNQVDTLFQSETYDYLKVEDSISRGRGFVLYRGSTYSGSDNWNNPFGVRPEEIHNDSMPSVIISPTCRTMYFPSGELSSAAGVRWLNNGDLDNPKGAVAFWGTTTHYCARFFDAQTYWRNATAKKFFQSITEDSINIIGKAIKQAKLSAWQCCSLYTFGQESSAVACSVAYMEWNLFGDPELNLWTTQPKYFAVFHETIINTDTQTFSVIVRDSMSQKFIADAKVCLMMDTLIYQIGYTDENGQVNFLIHPIHTGKLSVTITKPNYIPYTNKIDVRYDYDVGCTKINAPIGSIIYNENVTPACSVYNYGLSTVDYQVHMKIDTFYDHRVWVHNHQPGTYQYVTFNNWHATQTGIHIVSCSTELEDDRYELNNIQTMAIGCSITVYTINASSGPNGMIYPNGNIIIAEGQDTTFTIVPDLGYYNSELIIDGNAVEPSVSYTFENVTSNHTIHTSFANITYQLNVTTTGNGSIEKNPDLLEYNYGSEVELRAIPDDNWIFTKWSGDTSSTDSSLIITMNSDKNICAEFIYPNWQRKNDLILVSEKGIKDGGSLVYCDSIIYVLQGGGTQNFYAYLAFNDTWIKKCSIPYSMKPNGKPNKKNVKAGGALTVYDNKIYAFKGGNTSEFWCYEPDSNKWKQKLSIPETINATAKSSKIKAGGSLVTKCDSIYAFKGGNKNEFWMYIPALNEWYQRRPLMTTDGKKIKDGGSLVVCNDTIFALVGGTTNHFYAYVPDTWIKKPDVRFGISKTIRKKVKSGASLTLFNNKIYALKGGGTKDFGYFDFVDYSWHTAETLPGKFKVKGGGALVTDNQYIYAFKGANTKEFYKYTPYNEISNIKYQKSNININSDHNIKLKLLNVNLNKINNLLDIHYSVLNSGKVTLKLYSANGRLKSTILNQRINQGSYSTSININNFAKGVYFLKYSNDNLISQSKIIIY